MLAQRLQHDNNHVEGYRKKENDHEMSPNLYKVVELFKTINSKAYIK